MIVDAANLGPKNVVKVMAHMLDAVGGAQCRKTALVLAGTSGTARVLGAMDRGYDFIVENAPRHTENLAQLRWIAKERADALPPVFGWSKGDIKEAISAIAAEANLATPEKYCPITCMGVAPFLRKLFAPSIPLLRLQVSAHARPIGVGGKHRYCTQLHS